MAPTEPSWDHWQSFLAVVEAGSLSAAARSLGLTQPTLGRHVALLEARLGAVLFTRAPQGLVPTGAALALVPQAQAMQAAAAALRRRASGLSAAASGTLRLTASEVIGAEVLPALLAVFTAAHPGIALELSLSNASADVLRRDADIAVRMFRPVQAALLARQVGQVHLGLFAHRDYLARHGTPAAVADLASHALIGPDSVQRLAGMVLSGRQMQRDDFRLRSDNDLAQLALICAGAGIGVMQAGLAARSPDLRAVLPAEGLTLPVWLVMHEDLRNDAVVRLLWDHLAQTLQTALGISGPTAPGA